MTPLQGGVKIENSAQCLRGENEISDALALSLPHEIASMPDTCVQEVCELFELNLSGIQAPHSQYGGKPFRVVRHVAPPSETAHENLKKEMIKSLEPFRGQVAVWRAWPTFETRDIGIVLRCRMHVIELDEYERLYATNV